MVACGHFLNWFLKCLLFTFHFLCIVVGTAFIVIGHNFLHEVAEMPEEFELIALFPVFAIYLGSSICIITFVGCLASIKESAIFIKVYAFLMIILCILQITFSSYYLSNQEEINCKSTAIVANVWNHREDDPEVLDRVQRIGQCCGLQSPKDFNGTQLPASCCGFDDDNEHCESDRAYQEGCSSGFPDFYLNNTCWIIYYGYFIAGIELGAVSLACFVKFGTDEEDVAYKKEDLK